MVWTRMSCVPEGDARLSKTSRADAELHGRDISLDRMGTRAAMQSTADVKKRTAAALDKPGAPCSRGAQPSGGTMEHDGHRTTEPILAGVWKFFATRGAVAVAFGLVLLGWPNVGLSLMVALVGAFALANGLVSGATAFAVPAESGRHRLWLALDALAGVAIGVIVLVWPDVSAIALLYLIAVWAIAIGAVQLAGFGSSGIGYWETDLSV